MLTKLMLVGLLAAVGMMAPLSIAQAEVTPSSYMVQDLGPVDLGPPSSSEPPANGTVRLVTMNGAGDVVGTVTSSSGAPDAAIWHDRVWTPVPSTHAQLAPSGIVPLAINRTDDILAEVNDTPDGSVLISGSGQWLPLPDTGQDIPVAMNDSEEVIGTDGSSSFVLRLISGKFQRSTTKNAAFSAIDALGDIAGSSLVSLGGIRSLATVWPGVGSQPVRLDPSSPHPEPASGCSTVSYTEKPSVIRDYARGSGAREVLIGGTAKTVSRGCPGGSTVTQSVAMLWDVRFQGTSVARTSTPQTIRSGGHVCTSVVGIDELMHALVKCPSGPAVWNGGTSKSVASVYAGAEPQGWAGGSVLTMNTSGQILISGATGPGGNSHGVLVTPSPNSMGTLFSNSFDTQPIGRLTTGEGVNQFSYTQTPTGLTVENSYVDSSPNALAVNIASAASVYARKEYGANFTDHKLSFSIVLGRDFQLNSNGFAAISSTETGSLTNTAGLVELVIGANMQLFMTYIDTSGVQQYLYTNLTMVRDTPYDFSYEQQSGPESGSLTLTVNGTQLVNASGLALPPQGVELFKVGDVYTPMGTGSGTIYFDNVVAEA